jgi:hypothetical protein
MRFLQHAHKPYTLSMLNDVFLEGESRVALADSGIPLAGSAGAPHTM